MLLLDFLTQLQRLPLPLQACHPRTLPTQTLNRVPLYERFSVLENERCSWTRFFLADSKVIIRRNNKTDYVNGPITDRVPNIDRYSYYLR